MSQFQCKAGMEQIEAKYFSKFTEEVLTVSAVLKGNTVN